ncbi:sensor histidine kinase [Melghirimyces algeriensis]|uniref:histidine kinase n=1 Tax=Melghirimyces algeriensis TaxID=910412 RepID=A0A521AAZ0_9BACL|nr:sensor histidine kinase [Melghirimyces algeriensis]SMO31962.1 two-component system, OmpR family, sensor kinase [Melghirimyces algeriensis]
MGHQQSVDDNTLRHPLAEKTDPLGAGQSGPNPSRRSAKSLDPGRERVKARREIGRFLRDRLDWILLVLGNAFLVMAWFSLSFAQEGVDFDRLGPVVLYGGGITFGLLLVFLLVDWLRWRPVGRSLQDLAAGQQRSVPVGPLYIQRQIRDAVRQLERARLAEHHRAQAEKQRHLDFMNQWVHQMKTPVSALSLLAQHPDAASYRAEMEEELDTLDQGLEMVLHMARLNEFALDFHLDRVDLKAEVNRIVGERKRQWIRHRLFPRWEKEDDGSWDVYTDSKWNRFVLDQLFNNAIKYASQHRDTSQYLHLSLQKEGERVHFTIRDEGPGIPPQDIPRVFDPFFTGENGRRFAQATGMGLYLVKQVVDSLGHGIRIKSPLKGGTSVCVTYQSVGANGNETGEEKKDAGGQVSHENIWG